MGISIILKVNFSAITEEQWTEVYEESLTLLQNYPFMDKIIDEKSYEETWIYADQSRERFLTPWMPEEQGWYTIGDMVTQQTAETFMLFRNINHYREKGGTKDEGDALLTIPSLYEPEMDLPPARGTPVFHAKTQGYNYHKYILGIACLIEDRLKPYAAVDGDITKAQIEDSLLWVNSLLEAPASLPDRCLPEKLLDRIRPWTDNDHHRLSLFYQLNMSSLNPDLGKFLQTCFDSETMKAYWQGRMNQNSVGTVGMSRVLRDFVNLGNPLDWLPAVYPFPETKVDEEIKRLIKSLLEMGITDTDDFGDMTAVNSPESSEPETIWSMLEKFTLTMKGVPSRVSVSMTENNFRAKMIEIFHREDLVDAVFAKVEEERTSAKEYLDKRIRETTEEETEPKKYDIEDFELLVYWDERKSMHPELIKTMEYLHEFCLSQIEEIKEMTISRNRMELLIDSNKYFLITKSAWDFIASVVNDDEKFYMILSLLLVKGEELTAATILKGVMNNIALLKHFFLEREDEAVPC